MTTSCHVHAPPLAIIGILSAFSTRGIDLSFSNAIIYIFLSYLVRVLRPTSYITSHLCHNELIYFLKLIRVRKIQFAKVLCQRRLIQPLSFIFDLQLKYKQVDFKNKKSDMAVS